ncbi:MFS transporter [Nocardia terpenica]|uniref:MFS transporter n=1 Tax=Nocardia terpenica TaxID=455432 RepID=UPI00142E1163|nr:MFS transporter [Nocardia terpenica]
MSAPPSVRANLLRDRDFLLFASGQAVSALGDSLSKTALPLLVLSLTGSGLHMGLIAMLSALPMLVLGIPAGAWADRFDRRRMMLWSDVFRTILVAVVPLSAALGIAVLPVLYAVAVPLGVLYAVFEAACLSCVPALVGRDRIKEANVLFSIGNAFGYIAGPSLAGVLVATVGGAWTLGVDSATFAISAVTLIFIRRPLQAAASRAPSTMWWQIREGLAFIAGHRLLLTTLVYWAAVTFCTAPMIICVTYFVRRDLGWSPTILGGIITVYAFGAIAGALVGARLEHSGALVMAGGTMLGGVSVLILGIVPSLPVVFGAAGVAGLGGAVAGVFYATLRAQLTPDDLLGRVTTTAQVATFGLQPLSVLVAGACLETTSGATTLVAMGIACLTISLVFLNRGTFLRARHITIGGHR